MPPARQPCGNPLFLQWVEELRDQARERGSKAYESYSKAVRSLGSCPVAYERPRDLVVLTGIGAKTVQILETKWKKHCEENGLPMPGTPQKRAVQRKQRRDPLSDLDEGTHSEADSPPPVKKRKAAQPKTYIPQRGSGGYGILLGLVLAIDQPDLNTQVFLTKSELIRAAQPYSDSSYDHSEKGTYFTAWSSMKTLIGKGYVYMTGNPHKYCLTEEGYEVACAVRALLPEFQHVDKHPFLHTTTTLMTRVQPAVQNGHNSHGPAPVRTTLQPSETAQRIAGGTKFSFWYIDDITSAMVRLDPQDYVALRKVEFLEVQKSHPFASQLRMIEPGSSKCATMFGFVNETIAPPVCSRIADVPLRQTQSTPAVVSATPARQRNGVHTPMVSNSSDTHIDIGKDYRAVRDTASLPSLPTTPHRRPRLSAHVQPAHPLASIAEPADASTLPNFYPSQSIVFPAGSYEIVLLLDTREIESKSNRDRFAEKLEDKGVKLETRALRLGDVCWIAKRLDGLGGEEDECVLDYVLERKRLDDLCASIRDGRYHEQCFRLGNSGISHVFYLVEDWQTTHHMEFSGLQIMTAKSQIQVHNRFILRETHKLSESIDFLATMTDVIKSSLAGKDLHVIPTRYLSRSSFLPLKQHLKKAEPGKTYHTSFVAYQDLNDKSASTTVRDKFARMLLCVKGMSAERVSAVLDEFETPREMWEAMKRRMEMEGVDEESQSTVGADGKGKAKSRGPDLFFADRIKGEGRRKIGDVLSRDVSLQHLLQD